MASKCFLCKKECKTRCSVCKTIFYCSGECQKLDWENHKHLCVPNETNEKENQTQNQIHIVITPSTCNENRVPVSFIETNMPPSYYDGAELALDAFLLLFIHNENVEKNDRDTMHSHTNITKTVKDFILLRKQVVDATRTKIASELSEKKETLACLIHNSTQRVRKLYEMSKENDLEKKNKEILEYFETHTKELFDRWGSMFSSTNMPASLFLGYYDVNIELKHLLQDLCVEKNRSEVDTRYLQNCLCSCQICFHIIQQKILEKAQTIFS